MPVSQQIVSLILLFYTHPKRQLKVLKARVSLFFGIMAVHLFSTGVKERCLG